MSKFLQLIEENNVSGLSSQVFNQKLTPESHGTYTKVLDKDEECAVVRQMLADTTNSEWQEFAKKYFACYTPGNSAIQIFLENLHLDFVRDLLHLTITKDWGGLNTDQAEKLAQIVQKETEPICFYLLEAYCRKPHRISVDDRLMLMLHTIDDKCAHEGCAEVKLAELYANSIKQATARPI